MFKKIFQIFTRSRSPEKAGSKGSAEETSEEGKAADLYRKMRESEKKMPPNATPEKLCGITKGMTGEEIEKQLTALYRRHNRAASSLDANLREEAETMLDSIVELRMKYLSQVKTES